MKIFKFFTLSIIGLLLSVTVFAANTVVKGKAIGFENKTIKLGIVKDYITEEKQWIESTKIVNGKFSFTQDIDQVFQYILKIEDKETSLFAKPGEVYNLKISYNVEQNRGQSFNKYLDLSFPFPKPDGINEQIKKFNTAYQNFMADNYRFIMIKKAGKQTTEFISKQNLSFENAPNYFVKNYVKYALAGLQDIIGADKQKLVELYLINQPVLYRNKEYMNFFKQLYKSDFEQLAVRKASQQLLKELMINENSKKAIKEIAQLKGFKNAELAQLYLLNGLNETFYKKTINQKSSKKIVSQLEAESDYKDIKVIATNILKSYNDLYKNNLAPDFTLKNTDNQEISLTDFRGKMIYLNFWSNTSIPSLRELKVIQKLHEKYGDRVHFVSINVDSEEANKTVKDKYNFNWTFLHYGNDYELREKYKVSTLPSYFIIDEKGGMRKAFAENPIEADRTFFNLFK